jgi:hypothetical protein
MELKKHFFFKKVLLINRKLLYLQSQKAEAVRERNLEVLPM